MQGRTVKSDINPLLRDNTFPSEHEKRYQKDEIYARNDKTSMLSCFGGLISHTLHASLKRAVVSRGVSNCYLLFAHGPPAYFPCYSRETRLPTATTVSGGVSWTMHHRSGVRVPPTSAYLCNQVQRRVLFGAILLHPSERPYSFLYVGVSFSFGHNCSTPSQLVGGFPRCNLLDNKCS